MDPLAGGVWALALAVVSAGVLWFMKTPKEMAGETSRRLDNLEDAHHELDKAVERLTVEVRHLATNVASLTQALKDSDLRRVSGRQPRT